MDDHEAEPTATKTPATDAEPSQPAEVVPGVEVTFVTGTHAVVRAKTESGCVFVDRLDLTSATARERFVERLLDKGLRVAWRVVDQELMNLVEKHFHSCTVVDRTSSLEEIPNIRVLGMRPDGSTLLMAHDSCRTISCRTAKLSFIDLVELGGEAVADRFSEKDLPGIRQYVALTARRRQLVDYRPVGQGLWLLEGSEEALLVSGAKAFLWNGREATVVDHPICENCLIHFCPGHESCDVADVVRQATAMDLRSARSVFGRLRDVFTTCGFAGDDEKDIAAALTIASVISDFLPVTPLILVEGSAPSEIAWVRQRIAQLLGNLALALDVRERRTRSKQLTRPDQVVPLRLLSSERIGPKSRPLGLDQEQPQVEGTARNQNRWVQWLFATESTFDPDDHQDNCVRLSLKAIRDKVMEGGNEVQLRQDLLALALWLSLRVRKTASTLAAKAATVTEHRVNALYAGVATILAVIQHGEPSQQEAQQHLSRLVAWHAESEQQQSLDARDLLSEILCWKIKVDGQELRIADLLVDHESDSNLHALGIRRLRGGNVFLAHELVSSKVFARTGSGGSEIRALLQTLPGAKADRQRIGPLRHRGVTVPGTLVNELMKPKD